MSDQHKGGAEDEGKEDGRVDVKGSASETTATGAQAVWLREKRDILYGNLHESDHRDAARSFIEKVDKWCRILEQAEGMAKIGTNAYFALCDICRSICFHLSDMVIEIPSDRDKVAQTIAKYHGFIDDITHYASCSERSQWRFAAKDGRNVEDMPESRFLERLSRLERQMLFALYCMPDCVSGSKMWQVHDNILQDSLLCMCNTKSFLGCPGTHSVFELLHFQKPEVLKVVADGEVHVQVQDDVARQYQQLVGETR